MTEPLYRISLDVCLTACGIAKQRIDDFVASEDFARAQAWFEKKTAEDSEAIKSYSASIDPHYDWLKKETDLRTAVSRAGFFSRSDALRALNAHLATRCPPLLQLHRTSPVATMFAGPDFVTEKALREIDRERQVLEMLSESSDSIEVPWSKAQMYAAWANGRGFPDVDAFITRT